MTPSFAKLTAALLLAASSTLAQAADAWPTHPIRFVVPFGPGGVNDIVARVVADGVSKQLGQTVIIENKPGAGSVLGSEYVSRASPDGYTFLAPAAGVITNPMIKAKMPYQESDLVPVVLMAVSPSVLVVPQDSPIRDLKGLITASTSGKGLNFSTAGTGSTPHFVAEMLRQKSGAKLQIVPYKSGAESLNAVLGQQVDVTSEASAVVLGQIQAGKLRGVASTWNKRIAALPGLATATEQGYPEIFIGHWSGIFAPKGTPEAIINKLNAAVNAALKSTDVHTRLTSQGIDPQGGSRADFVKFLSGEKARLAPIAKDAQMRED